MSLREKDIVVSVFENKAEKEPIPLPGAIEGLSATQEKRILAKRVCN
jgi:hypothetical protein